MTSRKRTLPAERKSNRRKGKKKSVNLLNKSRKSVTSISIRAHNQELTQHPWQSDKLL